MGQSSAANAPTSGTTIDSAPNSGGLGPVSAVALVCAGVFTFVTCGAWILGYAEPVDVGLAASVFSLRMMGTVVAVLAMQGWVLWSEIWTGLSWVAGFGLLGWMNQQSMSGLAVLAALAVLVVVVGRRDPAFVSDAPRVVRRGMLWCAGGSLLLLWLPSHVELTARGWRALHEALPWLMVL